MKKLTMIAIAILFTGWSFTNLQAECSIENPEDCVTTPPGSGVQAPTQPSAFSGLPLDLLPPGARALGLGGAFTAVADDSTAALANPAGLTNLSAPELSLFLRYSDTDVRFLDPDAYNSAFDAMAGQVQKTYSDSSTDVSFASFVLPMEGMVWSLFYSNQLGFEAVQSMEDVYLDGVERPFQDTTWQFLDLYTNYNSVKADVENLGASVAVRFTDRLSVGVTVRNSKMDLESRDVFQIDNWNNWEWLTADLVAQITEGRFATTEEAREYLPIITDSYRYSTGVTGSSEELVLDLGAYYRGDKWSFGMVYHSGSKFNFTNISSLDSTFSCNPYDDFKFEVCRIVQEAFIPDSYYPDSAEAIETSIRLPSVISFGTAWRPADTWLISFDVNFIEYSVLDAPRNLTLGFELDINDEEDRSLWYDPNVSSISGPITEPISDEMTFHIGAEKSFFFDAGILRTLALRGGAFNVVDHDGVVATDQDEIVYTLGVGSTWGKNELGAKVFQMDLGASIADDSTNIVLSGIFRF